MPIEFNGDHTTAYKDEVKSGPLSLLYITRFKIVVSVCQDNVDYNICLYLGLNFIDLCLFGDKFNWVLPFCHITTFPENLCRDYCLRNSPCLKHIFVGRQ